MIRLLDLDKAHLMCTAGADPQSKKLHSPSKINNQG